MRYNNNRGIQLLCFIQEKPHRKPKELFFSRKKLKYVPIKH